MMVKFRVVLLDSDFYHIVDEIIDSETKQFSKSSGTFSLIFSQNIAIKGIVIQPEPDKTEKTFVDLTENDKEVILKENTYRTITLKTQKRKEKKKSYYKKFKAKWNIQ